MSSMGASLGKIAYYLDAKQDLDQDIKERNFNPIIASRSVTSEMLVSEIMNHCNSMIDKLSLANFSSNLTSRYILRLSSIQSEQEEKKKEEEKQGDSCSSCACDCCGYFSCDCCLGDSCLGKTCLGESCSCCTCEACCISC